MPNKPSPAKQIRQQLIFHSHEKRKVATHWGNICTKEAVYHKLQLQKVSGVPHGDTVKEIWVKLGGVVFGGGLKVQLEEHQAKEHKEGGEEDPIQGLLQPKADRGVPGVDEDLPNDEREDRGVQKNCKKEKKSERHGQWIGLKGGGRRKYRGASCHE